MPEWLNGTVSKTVVGLVSTEGSNPSLPAIEQRAWKGALLVPPSALIERVIFESLSSRHGAARLKRRVVVIAAVIQNLLLLSGDKSNQISYIELDIIIFVVNLLYLCASLFVDSMINSGGEVFLTNQMSIVQYSHSLVFFYRENWGPAGEASEVTES